jgi:hypothetical protein
MLVKARQTTPRASSRLELRESFGSDDYAESYLLDTHIDWLATQPSILVSHEVRSFRNSDSKSHDFSEHGVMSYLLRKAPPIMPSDKLIKESEPPCIRKRSFGMQFEHPNCLAALSAGILSTIIAPICFARAERNSLLKLDFKTTLSKEGAILALSPYWANQYRATHFSRGYLDGGRPRLICQKIQRPSTVCGLETN